MENNMIKDKLDSLRASLPYYDLVDFKFAKDLAHDLELIKWFADAGELRAFYKKDIKSYSIKMVKGRVQIYVGTIFDGCLARPNSWVNDYIKKFWTLNKNIAMCPRADYRSIQEIQTQPGVISFTDDTIVWSDGSFKKGNIYTQSTINTNNVSKHRAKVIELLNSL